MFGHIRVALPHKWLLTFAFTRVYSARPRLFRVGQNENSQQALAAFNWIKKHEVEKTRERFDGTNIKLNLP